MNAATSPVTEETLQRGRGRGASPPIYGSNISCHGRGTATSLKLPPPAPSTLSHLGVLHGCARFAPHCSGPSDWRPESSLLPDRGFRKLPAGDELSSAMVPRRGICECGTCARSGARAMSATLKPLGRVGMLRAPPSISCTRVGVRARGGVRTRGVPSQRAATPGRGNAGEGRVWCRRRLW